MSSTDGDDELRATDDEAESWLRKAVAAPSNAQRRLPEAGQLIGDKYRIEEQLGSGGMGAVFRAVHVVSHKSVALKWMRRSAADEGARRRFTREARAAGRIDHPNVVNVYDIGQEADAVYLVMELLRGESLRARLARGPLSPTAAVDLLLPAMRGVAAVHREGVIHRDLKPDNLFLCRGSDGGEREAKVLDFGVSIVSTLDDDTQSTLTQEGTLLGTPAYMPPEQFESSRDVDARADVYAFGVILYEALTGCVPFQGTSYGALVIAIVNSEPVKPCQLRPEIPVGLERVVLHAMARDRALRPATMDALIAEIAPFGTPDGHAGEDVSLAALPRPRAVRHALIATVLAALAALCWWLGQPKAVAPAVHALESRRVSNDAAFSKPTASGPAPALVEASIPNTPSEPPHTEGRQRSAAQRIRATKSAHKPSVDRAPNVNTGRAGSITLDDR